MSEQAGTDMAKVVEMAATSLGLTEEESERFALAIPVVREQMPDADLVDVFAHAAAAVREEGEAR